MAISCRRQEQKVFGSLCKVPQVYALFLTKFVISRHIFMKIPNDNFHLNPSNESTADTGGQMDMTHLKCVFRVYANAPVQQFLSCFKLTVFLLALPQNFRIL
jgi:hypothetical protein